MLLKFCYYNHQYMPLHLALLFWFLLDDFSGLRLDSLLFKKLITQNNSQTIKERYLFFIKTFRVYFCIIFFASGFSKILFGGLNWIFSDSLLYYINLQNYANAGVMNIQPFQKFNHFIQKYPILVRLIALDTVLIELLSPLALFSKLMSKLIPLHLFLFLIGVYVILYIDFTVWFCLFLFWLPLLNEEPTFG